MSEIEKVVLNYVGEDDWSRPVYEVGHTGTYVKDIELGKYEEPSLYWSCPKNERDGEPDYPFKMKEGVKLVINGPHSERREAQRREDKKFVISKMIAANEYKDGETSIEWLNLASGIHDLELTKELLAELKENPMELVYDKLEGWIKKEDVKEYFDVTYKVNDSIYSSFIAYASSEESVKEYCNKKHSGKDSIIRKCNDRELDEAIKKRKSIVDVDKQVQLDAMKALKKWNLNSDDISFRYQMLSRLLSDCEYYLGNGNRFAKHLWAGNEVEQIAIMKHLYDSFPNGMKPEWLPMDKIEDYEKEMIQKKPLDQKITEAEEILKHSGNGPDGQDGPASLEVVKSER